MKLVGTFGFVATVCVFCVVMTNAVPTRDRIDALRLWRTDESDYNGRGWESGKLLERISSMGRLLAHDARKIYRKSFEGIKIDDLRAMLDQLCDGEIRLWDELDVLENQDESEDSEDEGSDDGDLFTELLGQLDINSESLSTLLSGRDRLQIDGTRMEAMMKLLDQLANRIRQRLTQLDSEEGGWMQRFVIRQTKSSLEAMLRVIDTIKTTIEDAEYDILIDEELEEDENDEETEENTDRDDDFLVTTTTPEPTTREPHAGDEEQDSQLIIPEEVETQAERSSWFQFLPVDTVGDSRKKRDTVTSQFNLHSGVGRSYHAKRSLKGGWGIDPTGCLKWTNKRGAL